MGLFDEIIGGVMKNALGQTESQLLPAVLGQLLGQTSLGNVGALLQQLQQAGLGSEVSSWLGTGTNMPVSPGQLRSALSDEQLQQMTQISGLPLDKLLAMLSQHLPQTIDRMSPNGRLEEPAPHVSEPGGSLAEQAGINDIGR